MQMPDQTPEHAVEAGRTPSFDDAFAARLRGFGPVGILAFLVILAGNGLIGPFRAVPVLLWAWRSRTPWREIGYVQPKSWIGGLFLGVVFGAAFKIVMKAIVMPLLGAAPVNQAYHYLAGNAAALPGALFMMIAGAGLGEETVFRGYLFERLGKLLGSGVGAKIAIVLLTAAWCSLIHYPEQGLDGAQQALITGLVFGTIFAVRRRLWMLMCAHAAFDLTAVAMIYWNLEREVAHFIFK
ncbi:MAG TPA: type II CAAX endopeptidase family protein [Thermoanaerobaculia bacterium]|nr:type II CAAX endopeptidase family protein [Thermoanaerobaculia bacterium]